MNKLYVLVSVVSLLAIFSCNKEESLSPSIPNAEQRIKQGGGTTIFESGLFSFDNPAPNLNGSNLSLHLAGDALFEATFVTAPAPVNSGLGAQFNHTSCIGCHPKDGRSPFPTDLNTTSGFFLRASIPGTNAHGGPKPVLGFGDQLAQNAVFGKLPEVQYSVSFEEITVQFSDGSSVNIRKPIYSFSSTYIPMPSDAMFSPRLAQPVFGLGLLEAIEESDILAWEDINDADNDKISGKANRVYDPETGNTAALGRFGWKANTPTVMAQIAGAYNGDIGITSPLFPVESSYGQSNGETNLDDDPEISQDVIDKVALYCRTLAVPAARNFDDPQVINGYNIFVDAKCTSCHRESYVTGNFPEVSSISNQKIYPYTDMLLHDMGEELADNRPDFLANGKEWKTRPLWGIGLTQTVNGHSDLLHDGRARNIEEAILWHGGEAEESKLYYTDLAKKDREDLIAFINSL